MAAAAGMGRHDSQQIPGLAGSDLLLGERDWSQITG